MTVSNLAHIQTNHSVDFQSRCAFPRCFFANSKASTVAELQVNNLSTLNKLREEFGVLGFPVSAALQPKHIVLKIVFRASVCL